MIIVNCMYLPSYKCVPNYYARQLKANRLSVDTKLYDKAAPCSREKAQRLTPVAQVSSMFPLSGLVTVTHCILPSFPGMRKLSEGVRTRRPACRRRLQGSRCCCAASGTCATMRTVHWRERGSTSRCMTQVTTKI